MCTCIGCIHLLMWVWTSQRWQLCQLSVVFVIYSADNLKQNVPEGTLKHIKSGSHVLQTSVAGCWASEEEASRPKVKVSQGWIKLPWHTHKISRVEPDLQLSPGRGSPSLFIIYFCCMLCVRPNVHFDCGFGSFLGFHGPKHSKKPSFSLHFKFLHNSSVILFLH